MLSDQWLQLNYTHGPSKSVSDVVDYYYWYDESNEPVGVSLNFEYANDFHYDLSLEEQRKAAILIHINEDLENTETRLKQFFNDHSKMFDFEDFLNSNGIKFSKIAFY